MMLSMSPLPPAAAPPTLGTSVPAKIVVFFSVAIGTPKLIIDLLDALVDFCGTSLRGSSPTRGGRLDCADLNTFAAFREEAIGNHLLRQVADDEFLVDLDLLGVFGITSETERLTAIWADTLLGGKIDELLTDRQPGIIAPLGSVVLRLLAPFPLGTVGVVLGIVQVIGAILQRVGFGASAEEIGLELPLLTLELFDFLLQRGDAEQGIAVATLPISDLLAELEVLASQGLDFGVQLDHFPA